jgi:acyl transferase domain-containing protein/acyl-CoA synthetase (AMP-forming)/AMP-acid ligase II
VKRFLAVASADYNDHDFESCLWRLPLLNSYEHGEKSLEIGMPAGAQPASPQTLTQVLIQRAERHGDKVAFAYSRNGEDEPDQLTYRQLDRRARAIASALQQRDAAGERVLVLCPSGLDFIAAIFGCFYAGTVAIPVHPPVHSRLISRVASIVTDAKAGFVLTTAGVQDELKPVVDELPDGASLQWCAVDVDVPDDATGWVEPRIDSSSTAFVQYTSGSTGIPKGVHLTHGNLLANLEDIAQVLGPDDNVRVVSWLPLHHDMGLIGATFGVLYVGGTCYLMPPSAFIQRPMRWLETIARYRADFSVAPNFAYELCVERSTAEERAALDLSCWTAALSGAEPVRVATMQRFVEAFGPAGFGLETFRPAYGLAEATLFVSGAVERGVAPTVRHLDSAALRENRIAWVAPEHPAAASVVGCGPAAAPQEIVIVDPVTRRQCAPDEVGEIWIGGANVAVGYWGKAAETEETFQAHTSDTGRGPFLRTGDLGFLFDGELFVAGRLKDVVIVRGRNYYPNDIEFTVQETHPGLMAGRGAVFSVAPDAGGAEQLIVVQEIDREKITEADTDAVIGAIRSAITAEHEIQPHAVLLTDPLRIPTTSSGKIRRRACKQKFIDGQLEAFAQWHAPVKRETPAVAPVENASPAASRRSAQEIEDWFVAQLAAELDLSPAEIDITQPFAYYGLDSVRSIQLMTALEAWLGCETSPSLAYDHPTIELLAGHLATDADTDDRPAASQEDRTLSADEPIAIIGIGCRFPGADGPSAFWQMLCDGTDAVVDASENRWSAESSVNMTSRAGGFLDHVDRFDAKFFGISPREASRMDPQQRLLLEVAWEALEDAGQVPDDLAGSRTGVFTGVSANEYQHLTLSRPDLIDAYSGTGTSMSIAANRLSYMFDLRGPSMSVDTACSSSLVAIHTACRSLRDGESTLAIVGAVNVMLTEGPNLNFSRAGVLAADGRCKTFDAAADGWVRGEGAGVVILKPLSRALADGDQVYAVIRGSAMNQDGRTNGLMAPSRRSQEQVLADAYRRAGVSPGTVQYVETQGLGTLLGDAIEAEALGAVLADGRATDDPCVIGSVKTNIGHLEAASGVAGVIKVAMSLRHRTIPATLNFTKPNPNIPFDTLPLRVAERQMPWPDRGRAVAGVSAFGFGGTNAHVVLAEAPQVRVTEAPDDTVGDRVKILPLSARSPEALAELASRYEAALADGAPLADLCYTAAVRRAHHDHRFAAVGTTRDEMRTALATFRQGPPERSGRRRRGQRPGAVFVVTGEGSHWSGMGQQLYAEEPAFRDALAACDRALRPHLEHLVLTELLAAPAESHLDDVDVVAAGVFAVQVAMAALWRSWGIQPAAVIGHGMGEVAAAHIAGVLSLEDAARLLCARARFSRRRSDRAGRAELKAVLDRLQPTETTTPLYSTVTGTAVDGQLLDDGHWAVNVASPVHISAAMHRLADLGHDTFLEISPHPSMDDAADSEYTLVSSLRSGESERESMLASLGRLYSSGQSIAWELLHPWGGRPAAAPTYPWQRERFWLDDLDDTDATPSQPRTDVDVPAIDDTLGEEALKVRLDRADQPERQRLLRSYLQSQTAGRLGMPPSLLDIQSPLTTFGVDSLMAAELRKQIEHDLGIVVPAVEFLDGPSVAALADWLGSTLSSGAPWKPKTTVPADLLVTAPNGGHEASALAGERWIDLLTQVPHVSDDDVDALLREVLQAEGDSDDWNSRSGS